MRTLAKPSAVLVPAALLAACSQPEPRPAAEREMAVAEPEDCLLVLWEKQSDPQPDFDRENDETRGGAISCATETTPSRFDAAILAIREAAESRNRQGVLREVGLPLLYIDAHGRQRRFVSQDEVDAAFDEVFDAEMLALMQRIELDDMSVASGQGGDFALGSLWLAVPEPGARPRIVTVNRQALREAAATVAETADTAPLG